MGETMNGILEGSRWKRYTAWLVAAAVIVSVSFACGVALEKYSGKCAVTESQYNSGYVQAVQDVVSMAYADGIVRIPFNSTHNYALMPWNGVER